MERKRISELLKKGAPGEAACVSGLLRTRRDAKGFSFLELNDGSSVKSLQAVADATLPNYESEVQKAATGASVTVEGVLALSPGKGQALELQAKRVVVHGLAGEAYPLQKKKHSFEFLRTLAHLRPRTNTFGAVARVRNALAFAIHSFFQERGFLYVHTPIITASDCEGAGAMFHVTTLDLLNVPKTEGRVDFSKDFFGKPANLTVSGQLEGECYATALGSIYTFGPTFRAENSNTSRHLAEFWMVEPEMAFCDIQGNMDMAEAFLKSVFAAVMERCSDDLAFFNQFIEPSLLATLDNIIKSPFERLTYTEAVNLLKSAPEKFHYPVEWGVDLQSEHERYLTEKKFMRPVILTDYPREIKAFYMRGNEDGKTVRAMDVLVPRIGEIIGGSQREERLDVLRNKILALGLKETDYSWYLDLRRYGTVPHSGFGLGFERAVQFLTGMENIRDVIPFPRTPGNAEF